MVGYALNLYFGVVTAVQVRQLTRYSSSRRRVAELASRAQPHAICVAISHAKVRAVENRWAKIYDCRQHILTIAKLTLPGRPDLGPTSAHAALFLPGKAAPSAISRKDRPTCAQIAPSEIAAQWYV